jgi:Uma2 family endonuclease
MVMSIHPRRQYTLEEYFVLDRTSEEKFEYFQGEVFNMSGASPAHEQIIANCLVAIRNGFQGRPCRVYPSNLRVKVPSQPPYRYPDLTALCEEPRFELIGGVEVLTNPTLIVEVLSDSTEGYDRGDKFTHYKSIPTFAEYLLIAQHRPHATHFVKQANNLWTNEEFNNPEDAFGLVTLDCQLKLNDIYFDVAFPPAEERSINRP